jgi:ankyrin repeat protein
MLVFRGNLELAKLMIKKVDNFLYWGLWGAYQGGHLDLVEWMILKGANDRNTLWGACQAGNRDLAEIMIQRGADPDKCLAKTH